MTLADGRRPSRTRARPSDGYVAGRGAGVRGPRPWSGTRGSAAGAASGLRRSDGSANRSSRSEFSTTSRLEPAISTAAITGCRWPDDRQHQTDRIVPERPQQVGQDRPANRPAQARTPRAGAAAHPPEGRSRPSRERGRWPSRPRCRRPLTARTGASFRPSPTIATRPPRCPEPCHGGSLVLRRQAGLAAIHPELGGNARRRLGAIAGEEHRMQAQPAQRIDGRRRLRPQRLAERQHAAHPPGPADMDQTGPGRFEAVGAARELGRNPPAQLGQPCPRSGRHRLALGMADASRGRARREPAGRAPAEFPSPRLRPRSHGPADAPTTARARRRAAAPRRPACRPSRSRSRRSRPR